MSNFPFAVSRRITLGTLLALAAATGAAAATTHRLAISNGTGSLGSAATVQTTSTGAALQGEVASSANTGIKIPFGVLGEYDATSNPAFGVGVIGISSTGYGVAAESFGANPAMIALAGGSGSALEASTPANSGATTFIAEAKGNSDVVISTADGSGNALFATSETGDAILASSYTAAGGVATLANAAGEGAILFGYSGNATHPVLALEQSESGTDFLTAYNDDGTPSFIVQSTTAGREFGSNPRPLYPKGRDVQISGDLFVSGGIYDFCQDFPARSTTNCEDVTSADNGTTSITSASDGSNLRTYAPRQTLPSVEDQGEGQLVAGHAYVRIDPAFRSTMATASPYMIFITPGGESKGLYFYNRTPAGFDVRENGGGRSTMPFDYRIVAKPFADRSVRLARVAPHGEPVFDGTRNPSIAKVRMQREKPRQRTAIRQFVTR